MSFKLIKSLLTPAVQTLVEADQPTQAAPQQPTEHVVIDDFEVIKGPSSDYSYDCEIHVTYFHPNLPEDGIQITADATLTGDFRVEDDRFSAPYGSTTAHGGGVYAVYDSLELKGVTIKQRENNFEFFKMQPEQVKHVGQFVINYLNSLDSDALEKYVDADDMASEIEQKNRADSEPDYDDRDDGYDY